MDPACKSRTCRSSRSHLYLHVPQYHIHTHTHTHKTGNALVDRLDGVDDVAFRLAHLLSLRIADQAVHVDDLKGRLACVCVVCFGGVLVCWGGLGVFLVDW
jgi:hypothetical protein